jgi:hypothetical protein
MTDIVGSTAQIAEHPSRSNDPRSVHLNLVNSIASKFRLAMLENFPSCLTNEMEAPWKNRLQSVSG